MYFPHPAPESSSLKPSTSEIQFWTAQIYTFTTYLEQSGTISARDIQHLQVMAQSLFGAVHHLMMDYSRLRDLKRKTTGTQPEYFPLNFQDMLHKSDLLAEVTPSAFPSLIPEMALPPRNVTDSPSSSSPLMHPHQPQSSPRHVLPSRDPLDMGINPSELFDQFIELTDRMATSPSSSTESSPMYASLTDATFGLAEISVHDHVVTTSTSVHSPGIAAPSASPHPSSPLSTAAPAAMSANPGGNSGTTPAPAKPNAPRRRRTVKWHQYDSSTIHLLNTSQKRDYSSVATNPEFNKKKRKIEDMINHAS